jgi:hypothetical protein
MLTSCVEDDPLSTKIICEKTYTYLEINDSKVCGGATLCSLGAIGQFSSYFCACDSLCLCFFKTAAKSEECSTADSLTCDRKGFMTILGGAFCGLTESKRTDILEEFAKKMSELTESMKEGGQ